MLGKEKGRRWPSVRRFFLCGAFLFAGCETTPESGPAVESPIHFGQAWLDAEALAAMAEGRFTVLGAGESMAPLYGPNAVLVVTPISYAELETGMSVVFRSRQGIHIVHTLVEKRRGGWQVKGLNNRLIDGELVTEENLIGIVYATFYGDSPY